MTFYREHPILLGMLIALVAFPIAFLILIYNPSLEAFLSQNKVWIPFGLDTAAVFWLLVVWFRPTHRSGLFWGLLTALFVMHTAGLLLFIKHVRPLTPLNYILFGPFEALILAVLLQRGMRCFRTHSQDEGRVPRPSRN